MSSGAGAVVAAQRPHTQRVMRNWVVWCDDKHRLQQPRLAIMVALAPCRFRFAKESCDLTCSRTSHANQGNLLAARPRSVIIQQSIGHVTGSLGMLIPFGARITTLFLCNDRPRFRIRPTNKLFLLARRSASGRCGGRNRLRCCR